MVQSRQMVERSPKSLDLDDYCSDNARAVDIYQVKSSLSAKLNRHIVVTIRISKGEVPSSGGFQTLT